MAFGGVAEAGWGTSKMKLSGYGCGPIADGHEIGASCCARMVATTSTFVVVAVGAWRESSLEKMKEVLEWLGRAVLGLAVCIACASSLTCWSRRTTWRESLGASQAVAVLATGR